MSYIVKCRFTVFVDLLKTCVNNNLFQYGGSPDSVRG